MSQIGRGFIRAVVMVSLIGLAACTSLLTPDVKTELYELRSGNYQIDPSHARVLFKVNHLGLSTYVGRFNEFDATLSFDPENLSASRLEATVKTTSVDLNDESLEDRLQGSSWFNTEVYPEVVFTTVSVSPINDSQMKFIGNLTFLGVTKPIEMLVTFHGGADNILTGKYTIGFSATGQLKRSDFGMDSYIGVVGDDVFLEVYAEFLRQ